MANLISNKNLYKINICCKIFVSQPRKYSCCFTLNTEGYWYINFATTKNNEI